MEQDSFWAQILDVVEIFLLPLIVLAVFAFVIFLPTILTTIFGGIVFAVLFIVMTVWDVIEFVLTFLLGGFA